MKFGKELDRDLVPEWRVKYLDYKAGKKHVKSIARAVLRANGPLRRLGTSRGGNSPFSLHANSLLDRVHATSKVDGQKGRSGESSFPREPGSGPESEASKVGGQKGCFGESPSLRGRGSSPEFEGANDQQNVMTPMLIPKHKRLSNLPSGIQYGSFTFTPPGPESGGFELPDPALQNILDGSRERDGAPTYGHTRFKASALTPDKIHSLTWSSSSAYETGHTAVNQSSASGPAYSQPSLPLTRDETTATPRKHLIKQMFSTTTPPARADTNFPHAISQVKSREADFFQWMDKELDKIESFYKSKEDEAGERLKILQDQLREMRDRRLEEIAEAKHARRDAEGKALRMEAFHGSNRLDIQSQIHACMQPIGRIFENVKLQFGLNSAAPQNIDRTQKIREEALDPQHHSDYIRRPHDDHEVPYPSAKRKLKLALKEYYRSLELLKSYAWLNRTAFRKINKKYDRAVNAHPPLRYTLEKVNKAWFVQSDVLENYLQTVEDLYARYFEHGNQKVATGKLRGSNGRPRDFTGNSFRSGLLVGIGVILGAQGLVYASDLLFHYPEPEIQTQTGYLLQIYAGYFLALYLFALFCLDCRIWTLNKINYVFIFEFDPRHRLDWRELFEFTGIFMLMLGLFIWLNFSQYRFSEMFIYYPAILISATAVLIFLPAPTLFHRSRKWFTYSHWRLLLAGLYPVEFRDFFLGDMYCSLTYFMGNIELFFCLYAQHWSDPPLCNSTHSRLLGFFTAVPGIWRALQCLRRYYNTRVVFPHLLNCGKYSATIMYYVSLSLYRIYQTGSLLALFITFGVINTVYCSIWDLVMDWSLCQPNAKKWLLRDVRGYKNTYYYYLAMVVDVILRFNWIFYAIYTSDVQHSSLVSFLIALSEVTRRGMWTLFRVENEHCANVCSFKASRNIPLPYHLSSAMADTFERPPAVSKPSEEEEAPANVSLRRARTEAQATALNQGPPPSTPGSALMALFSKAHAQDFEKKKQGEGGSVHLHHMSHEDGVECSSDEYEEEDEG